MATRAEVALAQQHPKVAEEPRAAVAAGAAVAANPPPAKGFRRKGNKTSASDRQPRSSSSASPIDAAPVTPPPPPTSASADSLTAYFKTLKKIKLLKPDEEVVLGRRIQRGEPACLQQYSAVRARADFILDVNTEKLRFRHMMFRGSRREKADCRKKPNTLPTRVLALWLALRVPNCRLLYPFGPAGVPACRIC